MTNSGKPELPPTLHWGAFIAVVLLQSTIYVAVSWRDFGDPSKRGILSSVALLMVLILAFFAYRWHLLRRQALSGELSQSELRRDFLAHLLGPTRTMVLWFSGTIAVVILWVVCFTLLK